MSAPLPRIAYLLADTPIPDDPRVRRLGDLLHNNGWTVVGIGIAGWRSPTPAWRVLAPPAPEEAVAPHQHLMLKPGSWAREAFKAVWRFFAGITAILAAPAPVLVGLASRNAGATLERYRRSFRDDTTWPIRQVRRVRIWMHRAPKWARLYAGDDSEVEEQFLYRTAPYLRDITEIAEGMHEPGVWVANDWRMLPTAARITEGARGRFIYDSHEFATEEYAERLSWRLFQKPIAAAVEKRWIKTAAAVVSVSPGISEALQRLYDLKCPVDAIRNAPPYEATPFRPTGDAVRVLYHGVIAPGRGLEDSIRAMSLLAPHYELGIRGPVWVSGYHDSLGRLIAELRLSDRVRILPPVPMTDLVREAAAFDVGLLALPGHSAHNEFALPNKVFEYMMAGLALCVSDLPAMAEVVHETGSGVTFTNVSPEAIAAALGGLTPASIDAHKRAALEAAKIFNWEREGGRLMALLEQLREPIN